MPCACPGVRPATSSTIASGLPCPRSTIAPTTSSGGSSSRAASASRATTMRRAAARSSGGSSSTGRPGTSAPGAARAVDGQHGDHRPVAGAARGERDGVPRQRVEVLRVVHQAEHRLLGRERREDGEHGLADGQDVAGRPAVAGADQVPERGRLVAGEGGREEVRRRRHRQQQAVEAGAREVGLGGDAAGARGRGNPLPDRAASPGRRSARCRARRAGRRRRCGPGGPASRASVRAVSAGSRPSSGRAVAPPNEAEVAPGAMGDSVTLSMDERKSRCCMNGRDTA